MENQHRYIEIDGRQILVTEEVYRAYKRPAWAEHKRKEREKRCLDEHGHRCTYACSKCQKQRTGSVLSLERMDDETGNMIASSVDVEDFVAEKLLLEELFKALDELDPDNRLIIEIFLEGLSEREIGAIVGLSQKGVNKRKAKLFDALHGRLKDFY